MPGEFPKVFGLGLPKSGTTTLSLMLRNLGFDHAPYDPALIGAIAQGDLSGLDAAISAHQSFEDWPWPLLYQEVAERVPDAGFILTRRKSSEIWLNSLRKHTTRNPSDKSRRLRIAFFGSDDPWADEAVYLKFHDDHLARVRAFAAERDVPLLELCWEEGDGWPELCEWLGVETVPGEVPHSNSATDAELFSRRVRRGMKRMLHSFRSPR